MRGGLDPIQDGALLAQQAAEPGERLDGLVAARRLGRPHQGERRQPGQGVADLLGSIALGGMVGDVAWLTESTTAFTSPPGTLPPGQSKAVTLTLNAAAVDRPGDYIAQLAIRLDAPDQPHPMAITLRVTPPKTWGKLTGTVSGADCSGATPPLSRATVSVQTKRSTVTLWTADDGTWSIWVDKRDQPVTLVVAKDGYAGAVRSVKVDANQAVNTTSCSRLPTAERCQRRRRG